MRARKRPVITRMDMRVIEDLRQRKAALADEIKEIEATLAQEERAVMDKLGKGANIEACEMFVTIEEKRVCNPSYKDELVAHFEQAHGIDGKLVEQQVRERWTSVKKFLAIVHRPDFRGSFTH